MNKKLFEIIGVLSIALLLLGSGGLFLNLLFGLGWAGKAFLLGLAGAAFYYWKMESMDDKEDKK